MAASTSTSFLLSITLVFLLIASMQLYKNQLASSELMTVIGGFLGSILFVILLTAVGNLENILFGSGFQTKLVPEVLLALFASVFASALIHRVSASTCLIFSLFNLFYMNKVSQSLYSVSAIPATPIKKRK